MKKNAGLTLSIVFEAMSLNYGESIGNVSELKKISRVNATFSYISRQAIRYEIFKSLVENYGLVEAPLTPSEQVIQFSKDANIKDHPEADLFGYMKTSGKGNNAVTRSAVIRISPGIALEQYNNDIEFATNKNFADRVGKFSNPYQLEQQLSLYTYTVTIDLNKLGVDENDKIEISNDEKIKRINCVLDAIKFLTRDIKGRKENLSPLFGIGGVYDIKNPFFLNRIKVDKDVNGFNINIEMIKDTLEQKYNNKTISEDTYIGFIHGRWNNEKELQKLNKNVGSIEFLFDNLKKGVKDFYEGA